MSFVADCILLTKMAATISPAAWTLLQRDPATPPSGGGSVPTPSRVGHALCLLTALVSSEGAFRVFKQPLNLKYLLPWQGKKRKPSVKQTRPAHSFARENKNVPGRYCLLKIFPICSLSILTLAALCKHKLWVNFSLEPKTPIVCFLLDPWRAHSKFTSRSPGKQNNELLAFYLRDCTSHNVRKQCDFSFLQINFILF